MSFKFEKTEVCSIAKASNGQEAIDLVSSQKEFYDCVILDLHMPICDGFSACEAILELYDQNRNQITNK